MSGTTHLRLTFLAVLGLAMGAPGAAWAVSFETISDTTLLSGSPLHVPIDGLDIGGAALSYSVSITHVSGDATISTYIPTDNQSLKISVAGYGDMILQLFEDRAARATGRIIQLANTGFYDGLTFHRIIDGFMIQSGDPTGTGSGGSTLGAFDDQFHVDLQHNRTGVLSMAKSSYDDSNDSQFFITDAPTRWLDFNHSIFGQLVEGFNVLDAVSAVPTDASNKPVTPVVMSSVSVFNDTQNAVLMLKAPEGTSGVSNVTVAVTDGTSQYQQTFTVTVVPDTENSDPFLADIPQLITQIDSPFSYQLQAIDVEGDPAYFYYDTGFYDPDVEYSVDFETGLMTVTPGNSQPGVYWLGVGTAVDYQYMDVQYVEVIVTSGLPGDVNGDNIVDSQDFSILKAYFGQFGDWEMGDFNGDGVVDEKDFSVLKGRFGQTTNIQAPLQGALAPVPEPASMALLALGGLGLLTRRRK